MRNIKSGILSYLLLVIGLSLCGVKIPVFSQTLSLPKTLIPLTSVQGKQLLQKSQSQEDYIALSSQFVTQENQAFCGIASAVMVLNALGIPAPLAQEWKRHYFTQDNLFNAQTDTIITRQQIETMGLTLSQLAALLETYSVNVEIRHGEDISLETFRKIASQNLKQPGNFIVVNYLRSAIDEEGWGHISPLAAYNAVTDQFLILDVSRYKYPSVWVKAEALWQAIQTKDSVSQKTRGLLLISAKSRQ